MNLILLLSALLSAIGGGAGVRSAQVPAAVSRSVVEAVVKATAARLQVAARPVQGLPSLAQLRDVPVRAFALTASIPVFADRLRE